MAKGILWARVQDRDSLLSQAPARYGRLYAHHVTLRYGIEKTPEVEQLLGQEFTAVAYANCWNAQIQAARVLLSESVPCDNKHPHVTISCLERTRPVESNVMLDSLHEVGVLEVPLRLVIEFEELDA